eukprot:scaffold4633_cov114-Isochrysis_galbana.AAC.14
MGESGGCSWWQGQAKKVAGAVRDSGRVWEGCTVVAGRPPASLQIGCAWSREPPIIERSRGSQLEARPTAAHVARASRRALPIPQHRPRGKGVPSPMNSLRNAEHAEAPPPSRGGSERSSLHPWRVP